MSQNNFRRSTGYYTLLFLRSDDVKNGAKGLYVQIDARGSLQRTRTTKDDRGFWNETFPIRVPMEQTIISLSLFRRLSVTVPERLLGTCRMAMIDLVKRCNNRNGTETSIVIFGKRATVVGRLVVILSFSEVRLNAAVALKNLLSLVNEDGELTRGSETPESAASSIEKLVNSGKSVLQSNLGHSITIAYPEVDAFVAFVDNITQNHPLLNVGWQLVAALYKIMSEQIKLDKRINGLMQMLVSVFDFVTDASRLADMADAITSFRRTIIKLLDQLIECALFIRRYVRRNFMQRTLRQAMEKEATTNMKNALSQLKEELRDGIFLQLAFFTAGSAGGSQKFGPAKDVEDALRRIRMDFELTPIMLAEMENSNHRECMKATRDDWLSEIVDFALSASSKNVLWMRGIPGSGKSTIAQSISHHPEVQRYIASHIFFKRENTRRHDVLKIIAYRLAASNGQIALEIASRFHKSRSSALDSFVNLILDPLLAAEASNSLNEPIVFILDALDECGSSESRVPLMQLMQDQFSKLPHCVRFFITSRPEADLVRALCGPDHIDGRELDHDSDECKRSVLAYLDTELKQLVPAKSSEGKPWEDMLTVFADAADGLFIWAAVAIEFVKAAPFSYQTIRKLAIEETRLTLDDLYKEALEAANLNWTSIEIRQLFAHLFALILPNRGALTIELLDAMLGFEGDSSDALIFKLQSFLSYSTYGPVQIHHKTFADFLLSRVRLATEPWYIDMSYENSYIAERCFLALEQLHFDMCGSVTQPGGREVGIDEVPSHIIFSTLYWAEYLHGAEFSPEVLELLRVFLSRRLLFWFKLLSYMKEFARVAASALLRAIDWVSSHSISMHSALRDANSVVSRFTNVISKSPTLIYSTALPLTSKNNSISAQYSKLFVEPLQISANDRDFDAKETGVAVAQRPFSGHEGDVFSVVFSPDMRYVISGSSDKTVRVWYAQSGEAVVAPFKGHTKTIYNVAVSPEGQIIASASEDDTILLWDAETGSAIGEPLRGHDSGVYSLAFSPEGRCFVSGSWDRTIRFWNVDTGKPMGKPLRGHTGEVLSVVYSPDGRRIVSGSEDKSLRIWDVETGATIGEPLIGHEDSVYSVIISPDGRWIVSSSWDHTIRIWDAATGTSSGAPLRGHEGFHVNIIVFSPDGRRIASSSSDGTLRIWDIETREAVGEPLLGHEGRVFSVAYSRDGSRIVSSGENGQIIIWDALTLKPIIGTNIKPGDDALRTISDDGSNLDICDCQFFEGWKIEDGWLLDATGEHRLLMPGYMRKLVKKVDKGLYVHQQLDLKNCNGASEELKGFVLSD